MSHRMQVTLTNEQYEKLTELSNETGQTLAYIVREALNAHLARKGLRVRDEQLSPGGNMRGERESK